MTAFRILKFRLRCLPFFCLLWVSVSLWLETPAQVRPVYDRGATGLYQLLKRLNTTASALMIGAHPDDEDTALLAYLARGEHARTAYLSLTRGDGGQNIIGPELGEALGVIRTEELLQARRLDGAEQYFTRAYDYGFSKTLAEAKQKWDEKVILCDVVQVIRDFRPLVVISQFSGTPADGHGQHQFAGYISPIAVKAAADATQCIDRGVPWEVKKFYVRHRGQGEPTLRINTGKYDAVLGRSYFEIAMEARSQHKSQEQGVLELKGDQFSQLSLVRDTTKQNGIFAGLEVNVKDQNAERALKDFHLGSSSKILPYLIRGYEASISVADVRRAQTFLNAIKLAAGIQLDAIADRETVTPGEQLFVAVRSFLADKDAVRVRSARIVVPEGWTASKAEAPTAPTQGFFRRETGDHSAFFNVSVPDNAQFTQPYWLEDPRAGDMFRWHGERAATKPFAAEMPRAEVTAEVLGTEVVFDVPVEYRFADDIRGEVRRNVNVVPTVTVEVDQPLLIVPRSTRPQKRRLAVSITNHSAKPVSGNAYLSFETNPEWITAPKAKPFELTRQGEKRSIEFEVAIPANARPGSYKIAPVANIGSSVPPSMNLIAYPHIQTHRFYRRTLTEAQVFDLKTAPVKVGYIEGSGDRVPEAIRQMDFPIEIISENELASGDLSKYDTIVVGIRAYQVRPDLVANNKRLLDFAAAGGTMVVQYQLSGYTQQSLAPYPAQQGPRVADENAEVKVLKADHPILNFPNRITGADFEGWVQERNLYNFGKMDAKYIGLLESHDAGEAENVGGLVVADVGKGKYVYCSYSLFRQLPAGVPGSYRLLANILSFGRKRPA